MMCVRKGEERRQGKKCLCSFSRNENKQKAQWHGGGNANGYNQYLRDPSGSGVYIGSPGMGREVAGR